MICQCIRERNSLVGGGTVSAGAGKEPVGVVTENVELLLGKREQVVLVLQQNEPLITDLFRYGVSGDACNVHIRSAVCVADASADPPEHLPHRPAEKDQAGDQSKGYDAVADPARAVDPSAKGFHPFLLSLLLCRFHGAEARLQFFFAKLPFFAKRSHFGCVIACLFFL